ncbi:MAG: tetratricopeptide repeat protein [Gemmatimonadota bacterium]
MMSAARLHISRILAIAVVAALCTASPAAAQDAALRKSDLVRFLSGSTYSMAEVATIVEANCLSFTPTDRDIGDFRNLGASDGVLTAIRNCAERGRAAAPAPAPSGGAPANALPTLEVEPLTDTIRAPVNSVALVTVLVRRGGQPYSGLRVIMAGSSALPGGAATDRVDTSQSDGRANIEVPTGTRVGTYPLTIAATDATLVGRRSLTLIVTAAEPSVLASPVSPVRYSGGSLDLSIDVRDEFGNPVADLPIAVAGGPSGAVVVRSTTGGNGRVGVTISAEAMRGVDRLIVSSASGTIGEVDVVSVVRGATMAFVGGDAQTGTPGALMAEELVIEVYDEAGDPAAGVDVGFTVRNGSVSEDVVRTDNNGRASVRVTAGSDASRPVEIRARSGSAEKTVSLPVLAAERMIADALAQGERYLEAEDADSARIVYRRALDLDAENADSWVGLGRSLAALGRETDARFAFEQALMIEPGNAAARDGIENPVLGRTVFSADVWGGKTVDTSRDPGFRYAEVRLHPAVNWLQLRGIYDDALNLRHPWLKRGRDDLRGLSGGVDLRWGEARRLTTTFEAGRRKQATNDISQNTLLLAQDFRMEGGSGLRVGGWVGRWFDRDDYVVFGEGRFRASRFVTVMPSVSYGDNAGSNIVSDAGLIATGRAPETEVRGGVKLRVQSLGWGFEPGIAVGSVSSDLSDEFSGSLLDASALLWTRLGQARLQGFVQYQSPPGTPSFWTVAVGLGLDLSSR